jgi:signal transduction histidine kinase/ActR/RegA family two-component response regulator
MSATSAGHSPLLATALLRWFEDLADRGIFTTDASLVVTTWNPWLVGHTGVSADAAIGRPLFELWPMLVDRGLDHHYRDALAGDVGVLSERLHRHLIPISRGSAPGGMTEMAQSARIAPLYADDAIVGTITVIEDVTERVVNERELRNQIAVAERARALAEDASKLKDEFLTTLSHEIRTPLNAVLGWTRILRTKDAIEARDHALDVIERNARAQLRLVEDLLDMSRVISGKLRLDVEPVAIENIVEAAIEVIEPSAAAKRIAIRRDIRRDLPEVSADFDRMQQAIWNLLSNAVKFTDAGGHIDVRLAADDGGVELSIRDTGQGIAADFLPFVFDRFRQADASASRRHGGLGLGLALVRQIVNLHGGTVAAESGGPQQGATFFVRLPVAKDASRSPQAAAGGPPASTSLAGIAILLIEDSDDGREMLTATLQKFGARVDAVGSGEEALRRLAEPAGAPDVLVADIGMPEMDGYQLIRRIRESADRRLRDLPAIAVTAYANPEDRAQALAAGYQGHCPKPIDGQMVAAAIARALAR